MIASPLHNIYGMEARRMRGTSHLATGLALGATVAALTLPPLLVVPFALVAGGAATLPDLDTPNSLASKALPPVSAIVCHIPFNKHRLLTHWLALWVPLSVAAVVLTALWPLIQDAVVALCVGYLVHILGDALTIEGVPLLNPKKRWHLVPWFHFRSGGFVEKPVVALVVLACLATMIGYYVPQGRDVYATALAHVVVRIHDLAGRW